MGSMNILKPNDPVSANESEQVDGNNIETAIEEPVSSLPISEDIVTNVSIPTETESLTEEQNELSENDLSTMDGLTNEADENLLEQNEESPNNDFLIPIPMVSPNKDSTDIDMEEPMEASSLNDGTSNEESV